MNLTKSLRQKAQGLPLNTIVIAILVIIVLLVIVVFFTSRIGESGKAINALEGCEATNPVTSGYTNPQPRVESCNEGETRISAIAPVEGENGELVICCGTQE